MSVADDGISFLPSDIIVGKMYDPGTLAYFPRAPQIQVEIAEFELRM